MDDEWQDFVDVQRIDTDAMPPEALKLLKEAWLHGARSAIAVAKDVVDDYVAATDPVLEGDSSAIRR
jgi:hypothetical protein